jgi:hypothetical protein
LSGRTDPSRPIESTNPVFEVPVPSQRMSAVVSLLLGLALAAIPAVAQYPPNEAPAAKGPDEDKDRRGGRAGLNRREPSVNQLALLERQRKCGAEWREMKAGSKVADGMRWPSFWSQCNARLRGRTI